MHCPLPQHRSSTGHGLLSVRDCDAGDQPVLVPLNPPLVQAQPGHSPGDLQQEDEADTDGRRDTEGSQSRHDLRRKRERGER